MGVKKKRLKIREDITMIDERLLNIRKEMGRVKRMVTRANPRVSSVMDVSFLTNTCVSTGTACYVPANILMLNGPAMDMKSVTTTGCVRQKEG